MRRQLPLWLTVGLVLISACGAGSSTSSPPVDGAVVFDSMCSACHGDAGSGVVGPAMTDPQVMALSEADLAVVIKEGKGTMPGFPTLDDADVEAVIDYVMTLWSAE